MSEIRTGVLPVTSITSSGVVRERGCEVAGAGRYQDYIV